MMNTFISKFAIIPQKKQVVKIRKIEADSDSDCDENHTCSRLQKNSKALVKRFLKVPGACQTSYDARPGTVGFVVYKF